MREEDSNSGGSFGSQLSSLLPMLTLMGAQQGGGDSSKQGGAHWQATLHVFLVIALPLILQSLMPKIVNAMKMMGAALRTEATRTISHSRDPSRWWQDKDDDEAFNGVIQRAILRYINNEMPDVAKGWRECNVKACKEEKTIEPGSGSSSGSACSDAGSNDSTSSALGGSYSQYTYLCAPPDGVWVDLLNGIQLERNVSRDRGGDEGGSSRRGTITTTLTLRVATRRASDGSRRLNGFINDCVQQYNNELRNKVDSARYMYTPVLSTSSAGEDKSKSAMLYKRYKLADSRTFSSFFHPEKDGVLGLVDQFSNKQGKFAIAGYPCKLGFLLYGPPGTGKTSFIKALAHHTSRHIVNIPLSKIKTNQELMNIMLDQSIALAGSEDGSTTSLPHSRVIFVMEDVDAAGGVVRRRDGQAPATAAPSGAVAEAMAMAAAMAEASTASPDKAASGSDSVSTGTSTNDASAGSTAGGLDMGCDVAGPLSLKDLLKDDSDKLNLAALLNILDGVVDTPERIIVMTTNHPEQLDPALIRPGRINRKVYLGNVRLTQAAMMIRHYFNGGTRLPNAVEVRLASVFVDDTMSPAMLESLCAEYDDVDELITEACTCSMESIVDAAHGLGTKQPSNATFYDVYSDVESSDGEAEAGPGRDPEAEPAPPMEVTLEMLESVRKQVEFYFSDASLPTDKKLLKLIRKEGSQGFVPVKLFTNFRRIRAVTKDPAVVSSAVKDSTTLQLSDDLRSVRRIAPIPDYDVSEIQRRILVVENLPLMPTIELVTEMFSEFGNVRVVRIAAKEGKSKLPSWLTSGCSMQHQHAFVEFEDAASVARSEGARFEPDDARADLKLERLTTWQVAHALAPRDLRSGSSGRSSRDTSLAGSHPASSYGGASGASSGGANRPSAHTLPLRQRHSHDGSGGTVGAQGRGSDAGAWGAAGADASAAAAQGTSPPLRKHASVGGTSARSPPAMRSGLYVPPARRSHETNSGGGLPPAAEQLAAKHQPAAAGSSAGGGDPPAGVEAAAVADSSALPASAAAPPHNQPHLRPLIPRAPTKAATMPAAAAAPLPPLGAPVTQLVVGGEMSMQHALGAMLAEVLAKRASGMSAADTDASDRGLSGNAAPDMQATIADAAGIKDVDGFISMIINGLNQSVPPAAAAPAAAAAPRPPATEQHQAHSQPRRESSDVAPTDQVRAVNRSSACAAKPPIPKPMAGLPLPQQAALHHRSLLVVCEGADTTAAPQGITPRRQFMSEGGVSAPPPAEFFSDGESEDEGDDDGRGITEGGMYCGAGGPKRRRRRRRSHSKRTTQTSDPGGQQLLSAPVDESDALKAATAAVGHLRMRTVSEGGEYGMQQQSRVPSLMPAGDAAAAAAMRPAKKDYGSWAAATPEFRAESAAKAAAQMSSSGGAATAHVFVVASGDGYVGLSPPRYGAKGVEHSPPLAMPRVSRGTRDGLPHATGSEPNHSVVISRGPDSDGSRGFGMGRGRALV
ncbi:hypothetical protein FOA52_002901 [Chlamydomonas sp. UWO 241]|nr:hypothetical protein FOA52_002901 [Chlamydomonas sp. UWO 241]